VPPLITVCSQHASGDSSATIDRATERRRACPTRSHRLQDLRGAVQRLVAAPGGLSDIGGCSLCSAKTSESRLLLHAGLVIRLVSCIIYHASSACRKMGLIIKAWQGYSWTLTTESRELSSSPRRRCDSFYGSLRRASSGTVARSANLDHFLHEINRQATSFMNACRLADIRPSVLDTVL
jgi:hypothetical protein